MVGWGIGDKKIPQDPKKRTSKIASKTGLFGIFGSCLGLILRVQDSI